MISMNSLDAVRVLDLSRVLAGPWCTQTLADLGADVVKVERPGMGDDTRGWGPPFLKTADQQDSAESAYFLGANRNKRSITCDLSHPDGQALIRQMVAKADVLVENFKVGDMKRYGLDYASLKLINPRLVYCSITGFGQTGPYQDRAGYDFAIQAMGGLMSVTGERDDAGGGPQKVGVAVADLFTGMYATVAILAALRHAERTGQGQHVDMALLDTQVAMLANLGANHLVNAPLDLPPPKRMGNAHVNIVPYQVFETAPKAQDVRDFMIVAVGNDGQFAKLCGCLGRPDWSTDPRFVRNQDRVRHREVLIPMLSAVIKERSKADLLSALQAAKVPCGPINDLGEVFQDPHVISRQMVQAWNHPLRADLKLVASPIKLSATPVQHKCPPPMLGEHTASVLQDWLGMDSSKFIVRSPETPADWQLAADLVQEYANQLGIDLSFQDFAQEQAHLAAHYAAPRGLFLCAYVGDELAGCCGLRPLDEAADASACEMKRLYVRPAFRRFGLGRFLVESLLEAAKDMGYACMLLDTLSDMEAARSLYQDLGFEEVPPYYLSPIPGTHYLKATF